MATAWPPVSASVVAAIFRTQNARVTSGTLLAAALTLASTLDLAREFRFGAGILSAADDETEAYGSAQNVATTENIELRSGSLDRPHALADEADERPRRRRH